MFRVVIKLGYRNYIYILKEGFEMKKGFVVVLVALLVFATAMGAFAASGTVRQSQTIERTWSKTQDNHVSEVHKVVSGYAAKKTGQLPEQ